MFVSRLEFWIFYTTHFSCFLITEISPPHTYDVYIVFNNFLWSLTTLDDSHRLNIAFLLMIKICTYTFGCYDSSLSKYCWPFNIVVISLILKRWWFDIYEMLMIICSFTFTSTLPELQDYVCIIASLELAKQEPRLT